MLIGLLAVGILIGISISLYMTFSEKETNNSAPVETQKPPIEEGSTTSTTPTSEPMEKPSKVDDSIYEKPPEKDLKGISSLEAKPFVHEARKAFQDLTFMKGVESLNSIVNKVENKDGGEILHQLYVEGSMLANLVPPTEEELVSGSHGETIEFEGMVGILNSIKDPENALLGALVLDDRYRAEIIIEQDSLNPIFDGGVRILKQSEVTEGDIFVNVNNMYKDAKTLHKIDFEIEGYHLVGYVIEFENGYSKLYTILPVDGSNPPYKSIREWQKIYNLIEKR
jgi:hypothetical protein